MFTVDIPYTPLPPVASTELVSSANTPQGTIKADYTFKYCEGVDIHYTPAAISPTGMLSIYFDNKGVKRDFKGVNSKLIEYPRHGKISLNSYASGENEYYKYTPNKGFIGQDKAVFLVNIEGKYYKITAILAVRTGPLDTDSPEADPCLNELHIRPKLIKITPPFANTPPTTSQTTVEKPV